MKNRNSIFALLNKKYPSFKESVDLSKYNNLSENVKIKDTKTHLIFENVPIAFGDTENKNKRVYDQKTLKKAVDQYNDVKKDNPYFGYIFDGHSDEDTYTGVVGKMTKLYPNDNLKVIMGDFKINKGSSIFPLLNNIVKDGDPVGVSMRILAPNSYKVEKSELKQMNESIVWLEDDNESLAKMFSGNEVEYVTGDAYIQRIDLTWFPSFNKAYATSGMLRSESVNIKDVIQSACMQKEKYVCLTDTCKYRYTMKDFVDLINKDESIIAIKDKPELYDDILKFAYFNMTDFNFNEINDRKYLQNAVDSDENIDREFVNKAIDNVNNIVGDISIFKYLNDNIDNLKMKDIVEYLYKTLNKLSDDENIFYQIILFNYIHQLILLYLLYNKYDTKQVENISDYLDKLKLKENDDKYSEYLAKFMSEFNKGDVDIYDIINNIFAFFYSIVDNFGDKLTPNILLTETVNMLRNEDKIKRIFRKKFIRRKS